MLYGLLTPHLSFLAELGLSDGYSGDAAPSAELAKKMKRMTIEEMAKPSPKLAEEMTKVGFKETRAGSK